MATTGPSATLIAAFTFGNLFNAAFGTLIPNVRGHGSTVFRDGKRLALVLFLASITLWAQIEFATELIDPTSTQACQIGIIFTTAFDQLARITMEQFSLWVIFDGIRVSAARTAAHILLFGRLALGVVFVALSRPAFDATCVALSSNFAVALAVVAADALFIVALAIAAFANRNVIVEREGEKQKARPKSLALLVVGLVIWLATSVAMLLGLAYTNFFLRTVIPATGLSILLAILISTSPKFMGPGRNDREQRLPEAPSPRPVIRARSYSTSASDDYYPPSRYEDLKTEQLNSMTAFVQPRKVPIPGRPNSVQPAMLIGSRELGAQDFMQEKMPFSVQTARAPLQPVSRNGPDKKSFFSSSSKAPASSITVGKLAISYPMLQEGGPNPLDKVATMDLATAAQLEREKRALAAPRGLPAMQAMAAASSQGPVGIPPGFSAPPTRAYRSVSPQNNLTRVPTVVRKEAVLQQQDDNASAATTGAWVSPASDDLRRRSPNQSPTDSSTASSTTLAPKTPVQQRATAGLPKTPRSRSLRRRPEDPASLRQETVMFVNNIVYDDPELVASVMDTAKERGMQAMMPAPLNGANPITYSTAPYYAKPPNSAVSVVNRPRPIPRKQREEDGSFYPHRRTRSVGSLLNRKSLLPFEPGSPTELPPLPPPPQTAKGYRPLPNDTKSMTFDEKVKFLVSMDNEASERQYKRRSSLPIMERSFIDDSPTLADSEARATRLEGSKRNTAIAQIRSIYGEQDQNSQRGVSLNTYQELMGEPGGGANSPESYGNMGMIHNAKRASSPLLPVFSEVKSASTTTSSDDEGLANVYYSLPIQQMGVTVQQARAIEVVNTNRPSDNRAASALTNSEEMTIMLDSSVVWDAQSSQNDFLMPPRDDGRSWHRRIGDETLSFSMLSEKRGSRRGPPPQPLTLSKRPTPAKQVAMLKAAEPTPLPSPGEALRKIEAQLKKYEVVDQAAVQSPGRQALLNDLEAEMGMQETRWRGMQNDISRDSLSTLAMSPALESRRTSLANGPARQQNVSRNSSTRSNMSLNWRDSRRSRLMSILSQRSSVNSMDGIPPGSRATIWQKRLAEAEQEFLQSAQGPSHRQSVNFLRFSSQLGSPPPIETPYEPELGTSRSDRFSTTLESQPETDSALPGLWTAPQAPEILEGFMWVRPEKPFRVPMIEPILPGLSVRPAQRKETSDLLIHSSQLWQKPVSNEREDFALWGSSVSKNMGTRLVDTPVPQTDAPSFYKPSIEASRAAPSSRPLTQRPPRRSKRFTGLADIIEDPQPLPNKRDTLGIFQFPWGEKSDAPFVSQRTRAAPIAGTMSSGATLVSRTPNAMPQQSQESQNSSFFDDDDEDEEGDELFDDSSSMGSESGDDFDDSTLVKIATLLQTDNVPSTNSFFGAPRDSTGSDLFYDYYEESNEEEQQNSDRQTIIVGIEEGDDELQEMPVPRTIPSMLWDTTLDLQRRDSGKGLPQPENWQAYNETTETIRARPRLSTQSAMLASDSLWTNKPLRLDMSDATLWSANKQSEFSYFDISPTSPSASQHSGWATPHDVSSEAHVGPSTLWEFEEKPKHDHHNLGLPQPQDWEGHEVDKSSIRAKPRQSEVSSVESFNLWEVEARAQPLSPSKLWKDRLLSKEEVAPSSAKVPMIVQSQIPLLLWSAPPVTTTDLLMTGLFDPHSGRTEFRTTTAAPAALLMSRKPRSAAVVSLAGITSTSLWMAAVAPKTRINWLVRKSANMRHLLWSPPLIPKQSTTTGMFAPQSGRTEFRTTTQAPAALLMPRRPRLSAVTSLAGIASTHLWMATSVPQTTTNWLRLKSNSQKQLLWSAPSMPKLSAATGLFTAQSGRSEFRTTAQPPAAIEIARKPRSIEWTTLESLSSSSLWIPSAGAETERNWLVIKDSSESKINRSTSSTSNTRAEQLLWSAPKVPKEVDSGLFSLHTGRTQFRCTNLIPIATEMSRKSHSTGRRPLEALSSTTLWTAQAMSDAEPNWILGVLSKAREVPPEASSSNEGEVQEIIQAAVTQEEPIREQTSSASLQRPARVALEQWQEALHNAISASYPASSAQRSAARKAPIEASAVDWNTALAKAMTASYPVQHSAAPREAPIEANAADWDAATKSYCPAFDVSRRHPVFAGTSLASSASVIHPAATGYTHNVAAVHPVFFGSGAGVMAHPAMTLASKIVRMVGEPPKKSTITGMTPISALPKSTATVLEPKPAPEPRSMAPRAVVPVPAVAEVLPRPSFPASQTAQRGRKGARISAMASRFEGSASQNRSVSRDSFAPVSSMSRNTMASRIQSPVPKTDKEEDKHEGETSEVSELDAAFYAQIEALEKKREQAMAAMGQGDEDEEDDQEDRDGAYATFYAQIEALEQKREQVMANQSQDEEEGEEEDGDQEDEEGVDAAFYAQIEALEKKRGMVEQMAAESFAARPPGVGEEEV